ncbi:MAG: TonB-dependent receptor plug domain-containing protein [Bacteroidales bacterium]
MKKISYLIAFGVTALMAMTVYKTRIVDQNEFLRFLKTMITQYNEKYPQEKIYAHADKPLYSPGEDIWFKIYLVNGKDHSPSALSNVVYADLIDPKGNVKSSKTLSVINGGAKGDFKLDNDDPGGIYKIKVYTTWLKNFGEEHFFIREITVQKVIAPRLLMNMEFLKKAYGAGDCVEARVTLKTLENEPLANYKVTYTASLKGNVYLNSSAGTDEDGKVTVSFNLPDTLQTNDGLLNVIINYEGNSESISRSIPIVLNDIDLQFFPEGGDMVQDAECRIAFKALNEFGKPADIEGIIIDNDHKTVQHFKSYHHGMGAFIFVPAKDKNYSAVITNPAGIPKKYALPGALKTGIVMRIEGVEERAVRLKVYSPEIFQYSVVLQVKGQVFHTAVYPGKKEFREILIPVGDCPSGVAQVTIFDQNGIACAERLVFINLDKNLKISLTPDKSKYTPREKVEIKIKSTDYNNKPVKANLSVAVVNEKIISMMDDKQDNILSWLLMSSDVKGKIEEPSFYFKKDEPKASKALDYLLMTQGYRRFTWEEVMNPGHAPEYLPEQEGVLSGRINHINGNPVKANIYMLEMGNQRRIEKLQTSKSGQFMFIGSDPSVPRFIFADAPWHSEKRIALRIDQLSAQKDRIDAPSAKDILIPEVINPKVTGKKYEQEEAKLRGTATKRISLTEDIQKLEEVVVIGYGAVNRHDMTGSVTIVKAEEIKNVLPPNRTLEQSLQGRAAGVMVMNNDGIPNAATNVHIRGITSVGNSGQPLYVVDGIPISPAIGDNPATFFNPGNIQTIEIIKDASLTSIYGSRAANGVIVITTKKSSSSHNKNIAKVMQNNYSCSYIPPRQFSQVRAFYAPKYQPSDHSGKRTDFRNTIYWNPEILTDNKGEAVIEFYNSDEITTFNIIAEGIGFSGMAGREECKYHTLLPFSMDIKIPSYLVFSDTVYLPLVLKNNTGNPVSGRLEIFEPACLLLQDTLPQQLTIEANTAITLYPGYVVKNLSGKYLINIRFTGGIYSDSFEKEIEVFPTGFPAKVSFSGNEKSRTIEFMMGDIISGSLKSSFTAFPNILTDLMAGVESILREPYGCFEQTSSSTYPNIMVLKYLNETGLSNVSVRNRALGLIKNGYNRLVSFETNENGYEWFGHSPAHDGLTAYGLLEFTDMKSVYNGVDEGMIDRTLKWILSKRDGKGGFIKSERALDQFGRASREVTNAYIVYALSESGYKNIKPEYEAAFQEAMQSKDPYRAALVANAAFNLNLTDDYKTLVEMISGIIINNNWDQVSIQSSITCSGGKSLSVEAAALYALAELKATPANIGTFNKSLEYIINNRHNGGFGSTQATILALKALTEYARFNRSTSDGGKINIAYNGEQVRELVYNMKDKDAIVAENLVKVQKPGTQSFTVIYSNTDNPLPYSLDFSWTSRTPSSNKECKLDITTHLVNENAKMGETVRITTTIKNRTNEGLPMNIALTGIPSGLSPQPWQLKELQEKGIVDFYEIRKNYVVFYFRQMKPEEEKTVNLDLKADIPGVYRAPASTAYLYYTNEFKDWEAGERVIISKD